MKKHIVKVLFVYLIILSGCITQFIPDTGISPQFFVVQGMITDKPEPQYIKVSRSMPIGVEAMNIPVRGCNVYVTDNAGNKYQFYESLSGTYSTSGTFSGVAGRVYTLHVQAFRVLQPGSTKPVDLTFLSSPMRMVPVPKIDSLYFEKQALTTNDGYPVNGEGGKILLNTSDHTGNCNYYRWDYTETWKIIAPVYQRTVNSICWISANSDKINVKATGNLVENRIDHHLINFISNETDRLSKRYRIEVNQYSVNENEYYYWQNIQKINESSGTIYDRIPSSVMGNMSCIEKPEIQVLGYFSVSAKTSKAIYIDGPFTGLISPYSDCRSIVQTKGGPSDPWPPQGLFENEGKTLWGGTYWIVEFYPDYFIITYDKACIDCTVRGTKDKPSFWVDK